MGGPSANRVGTAYLLSYLDNVQGLLERYNADSAREPRAIDLLEQIKDLSAITSDFDAISVSKGRRLAQIGALSTANLVQLQSVCNSAADVTQECSEFVGPLQSGLLHILRDRDNRGHVSPTPRLGEQTWYDEIFEALEIRTDVLQMLFCSVNLLHHKNDRDAEGNLPTETRSLASKLQCQIAFINPKLRTLLDQNIAVVCLD